MGVQVQESLEGWARRLSLLSFLPPRFCSSISLQVCSPLSSSRMRLFLAAIAAGSTLLVQAQLGGDTSSPYEATPYLAWPHPKPQNNGAFLPKDDDTVKRIQFDTTVPEHPVNPVPAWDRHPLATPMKQHQVGRLSKRQAITQSDAPFPPSECTLSSHLRARPRRPQLTQGPAFD